MHKSFTSLGTALLLSACAGVAKGPEAPQLPEVLAHGQQQIRAYTDVTRIIETHAAPSVQYVEPPQPTPKPVRIKAERPKPVVKVRTPEPQPIHISMTDLPPNPRPGACYAQVEAQSIAVNQVVHVPAVYEWVEEQVEVAPARETWETIPAIYETVTEQVMSSVEEPVTRFRIVEEQVLVSPGRSVWKPGRGLIEKVDGHTGQVMCLVEIPPVYETIARKVPVPTQETQRVLVPVDVQKQVLVQPETRRRIIQPPVFETRRVKKLVRPAYERLVRNATPSLASASGTAHHVWKEVVCETNMSHDFVIELQLELKRRGHFNGEIDGRYGPVTEQAVRQLQQHKGLPQGSLNVETVEHLGLDPRVGRR